MLRAKQCKNQMWRYDNKQTKRGSDFFFWMFVFIFSIFTATGCTQEIQHNAAVISSNGASSPAGLYRCPIDDFYLCTACTKGNNHVCIVFCCHNLLVISWSLDCITLQPEWWERTVPLPDIKGVFFFFFFHYYYILYLVFSCVPGDMTSLSCDAFVPSEEGGDQ